MTYNFEWDPKKAKSNITKHGVSFENAASVFKDPRALTIPDTAHGGEEERWITMGIASNGSLLIVHHTFIMLNKERATVRIISSRKAAARETRQYNEVK